MLEASVISYLEFAFSATLTQGVTWSLVCNMVPNALVGIVTLRMLNLMSKMTIWKASFLLKLYVGPYDKIHLFLKLQIFILMLIYMVEL